MSTPPSGRPSAATRSDFACSLQVLLMSFEVGDRGDGSSEGSLPRLPCLGGKDPAPGHSEVDNSWSAAAQLPFQPSCAGDNVLGRSGCEGRAVASPACINRAASAGANWVADKAAMPRRRLRVRALARPRRDGWLSWWSLRVNNAPQLAIPAASRTCCSSRKLLGKSSSGAGCSSSVQLERSRC